MVSPRQSNSHLLGPNQQGETPAPVELYRHPSQEREGKIGKRGRASKPKVKSGCITCKARRVKCDETKPACMRCQKFGRACDGYSPEPSQSRNLTQLQPRNPSVSSYSPSLSIHSSEEESRYFQVFSEKVIFGLSGYFAGTPSGTFWTRLVLQECHNTSSVRHAAIAISALTMSLEATPGPNLRVNNVQAMDQKHHEQAVLQHLKAITELNRYISTSTSPQIRNALITCLLFVCFEAIQGSAASCIQQTYGGLKMLRSYYTAQVPQAGRRQSSTQSRQSNRSPYSQGYESRITGGACPQQIEGYLQDEGSNLLPKFAEGAFTLPPAAEYNLYQGMADIEDMTQDNAPIVYSPSDCLDTLPSNGSSTNWQSGHDQYFAMGPGHVTSTPSSPLAEIRSSRAPPFILPYTPGPSSGFERPQSSPLPVVPALQSDLIIEEVIIQTFVRLNGPGLFFAMIPRLPPLVWDINKTYHKPIPSVFPDFQMAHSCWDFLMNQVLQFCQRTLYNRYFSPTSDSQTAISQELAFWRDQLSTFEAAFQPIIDTSIRIDGTVTNPAALVISLYQKCTNITLSVIPEDSEMVYDECISDFQYIIRTCRTLIASWDSHQLPQNPRLSLDVGIIPPLHLLATKCRDPVLRREAIDLLFSNPRQEGIWDSILCARIGRWVVRCEEEGLYLPDLPPHDSVMPGLWSRDILYDQFEYPDITGTTSNASPHSTWDNTKGISEGHPTMVTIGWNEFAAKSDGGGLLNSVGVRPNQPIAIRPRQKKSKGSMAETRIWLIPEENRVQLKLVNVHTPDRYINVKCTHSRLNGDGTRTERETVFTW